MMMLERYTVAPAETRARAVSRPMPWLAPVTRAVRPLRSLPATTSMAVDDDPNTFAMLYLLC